MASRCRGWNSVDAKEVRSGGERVSTTRPTGDYKRISFGNKAEPILTRGLPESKYHTITWREGVTEEVSVRPPSTGKGRLSGCCRAARSRRRADGM
jgi:hypothetical protein